MPSTHTFIYQQAMLNMLSGILPGPAGSNLSAHLMKPTFMPDQTGQQTLADIAAHEMTARDYKACRVNGSVVSASADSWSFTSDSLTFGDPVTVPPFRFLVIAYGNVTAAASAKHLLMCADFLPEGGALEATNGALKIDPPSGGWFTISLSQ